MKPNYWKEPSQYATQSSRTMNGQTRSFVNEDISYHILTNWFCWLLLQVTQPQTSQALDFSHNQMKRIRILPILYFKYHTQHLDSSCVFKLIIVFCRLN